MVFPSSDGKASPHRLRAFWAIRPTAPLLRELSAKLLPRLTDVLGSEWRPVARDNLHLTIKFLGPMNAATLSEMVEQVRSAVSHFSPVSLRLDRTGAFPSLAYARVFWIGAKAGDSAISALHRLVDIIAAGHGVPSAVQDYQPHMTIARARVPVAVTRKRAQSLAAGFAGDFVGNSLTLFASELRPTGAVHTALATVPLEGEAS